jgi:hypothetical protein
MLALSKKLIFSAMPPCFDTAAARTLIQVKRPEAARFLIR